MNEQNRDLVAAHAQGLLTGRAAEDAATRIEADPELASEYAAQVTALAFLRSSTAPRMTLQERSVLHLKLQEQLGLMPSAVPRRRIPWRQSVFGLATATAIIAAIVILPGTVTEDSLETALQPAPVELEMSEVTDPTLAATSLAGQETEQFADPLRDAEAPEPAAIYDTGSVPVEELLEYTRGALSPQTVDERLASLEFTTKAFLDMGVLAVCIEAIALDLPPGTQRAIPIGSTEIDGVTIVHLGLDFGSGIEAALSVDLAACEVVSPGS